jgi:Cupin domain
VSTRRERLGQRNFFDELIRLRDQQREQRRGALQVIKRGELPLELNPHGYLRWYLHPFIEDTAIRALMFYSQEIPPGSRSGKQKHPGEMMFYVVSGRGHTLIDGVRHPWKADDVFCIPTRQEGTIYQHFNDDSDQPAELVACELNQVHRLGVDRGSAFEELENAPEYAAAQAAARRGPAAGR